MRQFYKVTIYDDSPAANPKAITFDIASESTEDARQRGKHLAAVIYSSVASIAVHARPCTKQEPPEPRPDEGERRLTRFRALHLDRVVKEVGPLDYLKIPSGRGWFERAECYMTAVERQKMAALRIPFDTVRAIRAVDFKP